MKLFEPDVDECVERVVGHIQESVTANNNFNDRKRHRQTPF